jgi:hypothetical protein
MPSGIDSLNGMLALLNSHLVNATTNLQHTTDVLSDSGKGLAAATPAAATGSGTGLQHTTDALPNSGPEPFTLPGLFKIYAGIQTHADAMVKQITQQAAVSTTSIDTAAQAALNTILGAFDKRDKGMQDLLAYVTGQAAGDVSGTAALTQVVNDLRALHTATQQGNATAIYTLMQRIRGIIQFINSLMIGAGSLHGQIDVERLISEFLGGGVAAGTGYEGLLNPSTVYDGTGNAAGQPLPPGTYDPFSSASSSGKGP